MPDRFRVKFPENDTIRIYFTRKYTESGIKNLLKEVGCFSETQNYYSIDGDNDFVIALFVVAPQSGSVFVSFALRDRPFVERLRTALRIHGIDPWIDFDDTELDVKLIERIKNAIRTADKLLLIFSAASKEREWVKHELRLAFKEPNQQGRKKLYVVLLTPATELQTWECFDDRDENLAQKILEYPQLDFSDWRELTEDTFNERVKRLAQGLLGS